jgi:8-oxo-dGTP pyrophosphatase MutT (NUDIX family)
VPSVPVQRTAGRVLLIDPCASVLLLEHRLGGPGADSVWAAPGGGCEHGETPAQAAQRELWEECGIEVELDPYRKADHVERREWRTAVTAYHQTDHFFVVAVPRRPAVRVGRSGREVATVTDERWFTVGALGELGVRFEPVALPELLRANR